MGCDIHIVLERQDDDTKEWTAVWLSDCGPGRRAKIAQRDYAFFSRFSVRGRSEAGCIYPRNLPKDVSRAAWLQYMRCATDYHSASNATLEEFCAAWVAENPNDETVRSTHAIYDLLGVWNDQDEPAHRVVFWFDN